MIELGELYAACIIEYARGQDQGVLTGPAYVMVKDARDHFNLPYDKEIFRSAVKALEFIGCLKVHSHTDMQSFYRIESKTFDTAMTAIKEGAFAARGYGVSRLFEDSHGIVRGLEYPFLESYADLGSDFLAEGLEAAEERLSAIGHENGSLKHSVVEGDDLGFTASEAVSSSSWTGKQFILVDAQIIAEVRATAKSLHSAVHSMYFTSNSDSENLKGLADSLVAVCSMAEPEVTIIDRILASPKFQAYAGLATLIATIRGVLGI